MKFFLLIGQSNASKAFVASSGPPQIAKRYFSKIAQIWLLILATCHRFVFNDFEYTDIVATCRQQYVYQQFNNKTAASILSVLSVYDSIVWCCILLYQHDGSSTNFNDDFKVVGKLLASYYSKLHREGIKLPTNEDSVATILEAIHA